MNEIAKAKSLNRSTYPNVLCCPKKHVSVWCVA